MEKIYIIDDTLEIPEEIRNLSEEEMDRQIAILEEAGRIMNNAVYVIDDHFEIPEYVKNMSSEERKKLIAILEEAGRREGENLLEPTWPTI